LQRLGARIGAVAVADYACAFSQRPSRSASPPSSAAKATKAPRPAAHCAPLRPQRTEINDDAIAGAERMSDEVSEPFIVAPDTLRVCSNVKFVNHI
jgi:hypothetical protein